MMEYWHIFVRFAPLFIVILVIYYILLIRVALQMLRCNNINQVLLVFVFIALIPIPPLLIMGIAILIIWSFHKRTLEEKS